MQGIIYGATKPRALEEANKLYENYKQMLIPCVFRTKDRMIFENGDIWNVVSSWYIGRGMKANIALIDILVDKKYIDEIIMPCLATIPYGAYNYFCCEEDLTF